MSNLDVINRTHILADYYELSCGEVVVYERYNYHRVYYQLRRSFKLTCFPFLHEMNLSEV